MQRATARLTGLGAALLAIAGCATNARTPAQSIDPSGRVVERLTHADYDEYYERGVSPDGEWVSAASRRTADDGETSTETAFLLNSNTGLRIALDERLTNAGSFSPDGRYLIGAHNGDAGRTDILEYDRETGEITTLAPDPAWDWLASYSPSGALIVFNSSRIDGQMDLFILHRTSGELRRLTTDPSYDAHAQFSPDGTRVLFHRMVSRLEDGGYNFDLYEIDLADGSERRLTDWPGEESYGAYAPDGRHIVFSSDRAQAPEQHDLYILGPDGQIHDQLTDGDWKDSYAYWTPDGAYIYFNSDRDGPSNIYRMPMDGVICEVCEGQ